jgi:low temperature requirement protein LtrA
MTNWFDPDSVPVRLTLLVGMLASLVMAIAIPQAFSSRALPFISGYGGLQIPPNAFIVAATTPETPLHVPFRRILAWSAWTSVIWIAGALLHGEARTLVWITALVLDYAGPDAGYWTPGLGRTVVTDWELEHAHFADRFQTFIIIALGESIVVTGATASGQHLTTDRWLSIALGFVLTAAVSWLYFDEVAQRSAADFEAAEDQRGLLSAETPTPTYTSRSSRASSSRQSPLSSSSRTPTRPLPAASWRHWPPDPCSTWPGPRLPPAQ